MFPLVGLNLLVIVSVPMDNNHMPYKNAEAVASKGHESKLAANIGLFYPHEWRIEGASDERTDALRKIGRIDRLFEITAPPQHFRAQLFPEIIIQKRHCGSVSCDTGRERTMVLPGDRF